MSRYVIVDLEMCRVPKGTVREKYPAGCEMIEIGAVLLDDTYEIADRFKTYIRPEFGEIDSFIERLTGITKIDTLAAPSTREALEMFSDWLPDDAVLVSWSVSDENQMRREMELKGIDLPDLEYFLDSWEDCQETFSEKMETTKSYSLSEALVIADIDFNENIHDGLVDAENTAMLFAKMKREPKLKLSSYYSTEEENSSFTPFADLLKNFNFS